MKHLSFYLLFLVSLWIAKKKGIDLLPAVVLIIPLLFEKEENIGFKNFKRGFIYAIPFLPLGFPYLFTAKCYAFVLNQLGIAFLEEAFFRGFLMQRFNNLAVSFMFAFAHVVYQGTLGAALTFFPSLIFGYLYQRSGSILAPALTHFSFNLFYFFITERYPVIYKFLSVPLI